MTGPLFEHYAKITEFLGHTLGPDYEIALHDVSDPSGAIVAIANNHISGRSIGAPLGAMGRRLLDNRSFEGRDAVLHFRDRLPDGRTLRTSALFIREAGVLTGMLCILFDDSRYRALSEDILRLCHPDQFVETHFQMDPGRVAHPHPAAPSVSTAGHTLHEAAAAELAQLGIPADRLTAAERLGILARLEHGGFLLRKGAVREAAQLLACSQSSIYRCLQRLRKG